MIQCFKWLCSWWEETRQDETRWGERCRVLGILHRKCKVFAYKHRAGPEKLHLPFIVFQVTTSSSAEFQIIAAHCNSYSVTTPLFTSSLSLPPGEDKMTKRKAGACHKHKNLLSVIDTCNSNPSTAEKPNRIVLCGSIVSSSSATTWQ